MKKLFLFLVVMVLVSGFNSCSKDSSDETLNIYVVPVDMAANYVALAFCNAAGGINYHMENSAMFTVKGSATFDSVFTIKQTDTSKAVRYQYLVNYHFTRKTTSPPEVVIGYTAGGNLKTNTFISQDSPLANWTITTLDQAELTLNGNGNVKGSQYSIPDQVAFSSTISYTMKNVMLGKTTPYMVASGSADIYVGGTGPLGVLFSYSGTLTYLGNRQAALLLGGKSYNINLVTGTITK